MPGIKTSNIVQLRDGSIDYKYYVARGMIARNEELKFVASKILNASRLPMHAFPTFVTVILLMLIL